MANRRPRIVSRGARRTNQWIGVGFDGVVTSTTATQLATLNAAGLALRPFTIVRTHLVIKVISDQVAADEGVGGAVGMIVVSDSAAAAGVSSVPTPITELVADWFVYQPVHFDFQFETAAGFQQLIGSALHWTVDSKAMRKVGLDDDVSMSVEYRAAVGSIVAVEGRMLIKLH